MIVKYFSVYDKKALVFGAMFAAPSVGSAERMLTSTVNDKASEQNLVAQYPEDFALYQMFDFDDSSGTVSEAFVPPRLILEALAVVKS